MLPCFRRMLRRNIFYTAVTRAKKKVLIVGSNGTLRGVEGEGQPPLSDYPNSFSYCKKFRGNQSFYGMQVKTIDISQVFGYAIGRKQGGGKYDYPTTIYEHAENLP